MPSGSTRVTSLSKCRRARALLDELGATGTKLVVTGDLDAYSIAALRGFPVDSFGVGANVVSGMGAPERGLRLQVGLDRRPRRAIRPGAEAGGKALAKARSHLRAASGPGACSPTTSRPTGGPVLPV